MADWFEESPTNKASRQKLAQNIRDKLSFVGIDWAKSPDGTLTGKEVKMLDYACGPGFLSRVCKRTTVYQVRPLMVF